MPREICHLCRTPALPTFRADTVLSYSARTAWILLRPLGRLTCPACAPDAIRALSPEEREIQAEALRHYVDEARFSRSLHVDTLRRMLAACDHAPTPERTST